MICCVLYTAFAAPADAADKEIAAAPGDAELESQKFSWFPRVCVPHLMLMLDMAHYNVHYKQ